MLTVVIPVKEDPKIVSYCLARNYFLRLHPIIVVNKEGGEPLKPFATYFLQPGDSCLSDARKIGLDYVNTEYVLNLDCDNILPNNYSLEALMLMEENKAINCVALDYLWPRTLGHLGFGTSIWRTKVMKEKYNWEEGKGLCECIHMWRKMYGQLATLPMLADHIKGGDFYG